LAAIGDYKSQDINFRIANPKEQGIANPKEQVGRVGGGVIKEQKN